MEPVPSPLLAPDQRSSSATSSSKRPSAEKNLRVLGPLKKTARVEGQAEARDAAQAAQAEHGFVYEQQKEQDRLWRRLLARRVESTAMSHVGRDDSRNAETIESRKSECAVEAETTAEASNDEMSYNPNTGHGPEDGDEEED